MNDLENIIAILREELTAQGDEQVRMSSRRFFKEEINVYGIRSAALVKIARKYERQLKNTDNKTFFFLCEELFMSGYLEEFIIAAEWAYSRHKRFQVEDFAMLERWVSLYVSNWAACDTLCNHTVGACVERFPQLLPRLKLWAQSDNRWMRRAAAVTLIVPAKRGIFLREAMELADILLMDKEDLVQKGYGWLLKEESRRNQAAVFEYVMKNKAVMPRTALRYAIELMPPEMKAEAMKK